MNTTTPNEIFCSYAHPDLPYIESFRPHLRQLERENLISTWYDGHIKPGQPRQRAIETHLNSANILLLFISADFLNSDFCMDTELPIALARSNSNAALVIPIILRPCDWQSSSFAHLQALPTGLNPITQWPHPDEAYTEIARAIRDFIHNNHVPPMQGSLLNLPFRRNPIFTGREDILQKLHTSLANHKETALIQAIKGLGGIGKSQTAIEYAYRHKNDYARIIWLNSSSPETLTSDVMKLAREINTPGCYDQDQHNVVQGFQTWLQRQHNWLLILDNVEDLSLPGAYTPKDNQGHLLLTTRSHAVGSAIAGIPLDIMNPETGATFLLKRSKRITIDPFPPLEQIPPQELQPAMSLSTLLGGLPLALDQAGGYIERKSCTIERYIQIYQQAHNELLAQHGLPEDTTSYKDTVATTWSLSFQQVARGKYGQAATDILRLYAFLAPDNIPIINFKAADEEAAIALLGPDLGPVIANPFQLEEMLETLLKYSLIRREDNTFFIHRLVQTVLRDALPEAEHALWMERTVLLINALFPDGEHGTWPQCELLLPHALTCAEWTPLLKQKKLEAARLLTVTGRYLYNRGQYREAEALFQRVLRIYEEELGATHPDTATSLNNLALLYAGQGRYRDAEPLYKRALSIREEELGATHPDTATSLNNLAALYYVQGRYEEAEPLYKRALSICEEELGAMHPNTATSLNNLAALYYVQGRYGEAEPLYKRALSIREEGLGATHPDTAQSLNNLAELYRAQGRYGEVEPLYKRALSIREEGLGATHPDTAQSLNNLAELYRAQGRYGEVEPLFKRALRIYEERLGAMHPNTATSLNNLAELYRAQGRYGEAEPLYKRAIKISLVSLGMEHPNTQQCLKNYLTLLSQLYPNKDMQALLQLLAQKLQDNNNDGEISQE